MSAEQILKEQIIKKAWEDEAFKARLLSDPKGALKEAFDVEIPEGLELTVVEESAKHHYLIIPQHPAEASAKSSDSSTQVEMW
ncbi:NHLP leader peptide family RiPP precursor [Paenibacillus sp. NPDC058174]|uniref:NHLP leader peptide family RiPP precursor n=1 Tax=Paenibacillus sp. NPDC058174 TaxID=3346366 RepID=UPI0036D75D0C